MSPRYLFGLFALLLITGCGAPTNSVPPEVTAKLNGGTGVVEFWATWCGPCIEMKPVLDQYEEESGTVIYRVDVDENPKLADHFKIDSIPAMIVIKNGVVVDRVVGSLELEPLQQRMAKHGL